MEGEKLKIALVGNPNCGKTSIFNAFTGLRQKIGNFPGVTVEKKSGNFKLINGNEAEILDLPGIYSLHPSSPDEEVSVNVILDETNADTPDILLIVADATTLKRNLLLITQAIDLQIPSILVLTMADIAAEKGILVKEDTLKSLLGIPVITVNTREDSGIDRIKQTIPDAVTGRVSMARCADGTNQYRTFLQRIANLEPDETRRMRANEVVDRYRAIANLMKRVEQKRVDSVKEDRSKKIDRVLLHPIWGYTIFLGVFFFVFQAIFSWASYPMDWIELYFGKLGGGIGDALPQGWFNDLLVNGLLAGLSGVVVFIPQIVFLFAFLSILEETGYMARVSFLMDRLMRKFGLNGKSVVPLVSGMACAVPAIMSARNIGSWKERLITILVTPLMSCSARLPVYTLLISLFVKDDKLVWGVFNYQGLMLMAFYILGMVMSLLMAAFLNWFISERKASFFILELPIYQRPRWKNVGVTVYEKAWSFVAGAGKVILIVSLALWVLQSFAPGDRFAKIEQKYAGKPESETSIAREKLEASYAGMLGKAIEPAIKPLGFDWKIGISLVTSFAAREVFVGTMSTIYSLGGEDEGRLRDKMQAELNPDTGKPVYGKATALSLMVFYAFAMQCMSTFAVTMRETGSLKWAMLQLVSFTVLAYLASLLTYQLMQ